jgi:DNA-binding NarL/FixJ family response regulator
MSTPHNPDNHRMKVIQLTPAELDVLVGIARGESCKEIAARRSRSPKTVETIRANLFRKIEVRSATQACRWAIQHRIIQVDLHPENLVSADRLMVVILSEHKAKAS